MIKGKNGFWLLAVVFSIIIMLVVLNGENHGHAIVKGMDGTMGFMIKKHHASGNNLGALFNMALWQQNHSMEGDHSLPLFIKSLNLAGFSALLMIFPLIVGTSILMIILWI